MGWLDSLKSNELSSGFQKCVREGLVAKLGPEIGAERDAYRVAGQEVNQEINNACKKDVNTFRP